MDRCNESGKQDHLNFSPTRSKLKRSIRYSPSDGSIIAVKQLSSRSGQGNREFLDKFGTISCLQHPNLVKLHGGCIEGNQLPVLYEYIKNNSLAHVLFNSEESQIMLDWTNKAQAIIKIARGLVFLHDESRLKIVHQDIKATNVLLDRDLNPEISDFKLARLNADKKTHIRTSHLDQNSLLVYHETHLRSATNLFQLIGFKT